ncbi:unnamed protein product [Darwinula stevensoni]|uniref:Carboxylic ester hydrolase n=1 Tax=Darwinula stevensoni TaxID=69355 RepID=A0A7R9A3A3_9CRUS|nr:unnamed protein product [Darwinula stevensoni]CAG0891285.1 unnamed protein product [Darwinula stevensoni]
MTNPLPVEPWKVRNATEFGALCEQPNEKVWAMKDCEAGCYAQNEFLRDAFNVSEDCLTVNVFTRQSQLQSIQNGGENLDPVLIYIHGGSFFINGSPMYRVQKLVTMGLVVVTFNYRLGIFGFLSTGDEVAPGNYGLFDQVMVLEWVRDNIRVFGGDAQRVTIMGNSAGAASAFMHMVSPISKGTKTTMNTSIKGKL